MYQYPSKSRMHEIQDAVDEIVGRVSPGDLPKALDDLLSSQRSLVSHHEFLVLRSFSNLALAINFYGWGMRTDEYEATWRMLQNTRRFFKRAAEENLHLRSFESTCMRDMGIYLSLIGKYHQSNLWLKKAKDSSRDYKFRSTCKKFEARNAVFLGNFIDALKIVNTIDVDKIDDLDTRNFVHKTRSMILAILGFHGSAKKHFSKIRLSGSQPLGHKIFVSWLDIDFSDAAVFLERRRDIARLIREEAQEGAKQNELLNMAFEALAGNKPRNFDNYITRAKHLGRLTGKKSWSDVIERSKPLFRTKAMTRDEFTAIWSILTDEFVHIPIPSQIMALFLAHRLAARKQFQFLGELCQDLRHRHESLFSSLSPSVRRELAREPNRLVTELDALMKLLPRNLQEQSGNFGADLL